MSRDTDNTTYEVKKFDMSLTQDYLKPEYPRFVLCYVEEDEDGDEIEDYDMYWVTNELEEMGDYLNCDVKQHITEKTIRVEIHFDREEIRGGCIQIHSEVVDTIYEKK